jgi:hypothetical protein
VHPISSRLAFLLPMHPSIDGVDVTRDFPYQLLMRPCPAVFFACADYGLLRPGCQTSGRDVSVTGPPPKGGRLVMLDLDEVPDTDVARRKYFWSSCFARRNSILRPSGLPAGLLAALTTRHNGHIFSAMSEDGRGLPHRELKWQIPG